MRGRKKNGSVENTRATPNFGKTCFRKIVKKAISTKRERKGAKGQETRKGPLSHYEKSSLRKGGEFRGKSYGRGVERGPLDT